MVYIGSGCCSSIPTFDRGSQPLSNEVLLTSSFPLQVVENEQGTFFKFSGLHGIERENSAIHILIYKGERTMQKEYTECTTNERTDNFKTKIGILAKWLLFLIIGSCVVGIMWLLLTLYSNLQSGEAVKATQSFQIIDIGTSTEGELRAVIRYNGYPESVEIGKLVEKEGIENAGELKGSYVTVKISDSNELKAVKITAEEEGN
ncbi:MAG: hypothetical protein ACI35P_10280 [Bacillus sp. (in: firmicutes)]